MVEHRTLILGGVEIIHPFGLLGHSDADVLTHAIMDAMLGALALGDIGKHFPDHDERYRGISSVALLRQVNDLLAQRGYVVHNLDSIIVAEQPKLASHIDKMRANLAETLGIPTDSVSVKATTTERLGFTGREEGIAAHAIVCLESI